MTTRPLNVGLRLMGPVGVRQTHLAVAILKGTDREKGASLFVLLVGSLLTSIQDSYNPISHNSETRVAGAGLSG